MPILHKALVTCMQGNLIAIPTSYFVLFYKHDYLLDLLKEIIGIIQNDVLFVLLISYTPLF